MTSFPIFPTNSRKSPSGHCSSVSSRHVLPPARLIATSTCRRLLPPALRRDGGVHLVLLELVARLLLAEGVVRFGRALPLRVRVVAARAVRGPWWRCGARVSVLVGAWALRRRRVSSEGCCGGGVRRGGVRPLRAAVASGNSYLC